MYALPNTIKGIKLETQPQTIFQGEALSYYTSRAPTRILTMLSVTSLLLPLVRLLGGALAALPDRLRNELVRDFTSGLVFTMLGSVNIDGAKQTDKLCLSICRTTIQQNNNKITEVQCVVARTITYKAVSTL